MAVGIERDHLGLRAAEVDADAKSRRCPRMIHAAAAPAASCIVPLGLATRS
jgi:hypothetical protein